MPKLSLLPFLLLASLGAASPASAPDGLFRHEAARLSMGCAYAIVAYGGDPVALPRSVEAALDEVDRIDRLMSHYKPESALSRLNREAGRGPVVVDAELFGLLAMSQRHAAASDGAFDVTVGPLMKAWGFFRGEGRLPTDAELADACARVGHRHVLMDARARTIRFDRPGVELDLGGIAKGYAVDRAVAVLRRERVAAALVSAGGSTIFALGAPPFADSWEVEVEDPVDPARVALAIRLRDRALAVSGSSEKSFEHDGARYAHVMDPRTCRPVQGVLSVAVLAETGTAGDALDNAFFVLGPDASRAYIARVPAAEAVFFLPDPGGGWTTARIHGPRTEPAHFTDGRSTTP